MSQPWGYSIGMDLKSCDPTVIRSKEKIQDYVIQLCKIIDMKRYGDCQIVHFGDGNKEGFTMVQLIETSNIVAHFANDIQSAFIDIFSCKEFSFSEVTEFTMKFFGADTVTTHTCFRGYVAGNNETIQP